MNSLDHIKQLMSVMENHQQDTQPNQLHEAYVTEYRDPEGRFEVWYDYNRTAYVAVGRGEHKDHIELVWFEKPDHAVEHAEEELRLAGHEHMDEGIVDHIRGRNYDRLAKRSEEKATKAMMKAADFDFSDLDNREEHEDEFMSQMAKRREREHKANKLLGRKPADDEDLFAEDQPHHSVRQFPGFEDGGDNYVLHYEHESGAELELRFALSADGYRTVDDFLVDFQRNHPSAVVLDVEPESPGAAASNNKLSEDHTMNDMRKLITVCESAMDYHNDEDQLTPGWGADDPAQRTINLDDQPGAHSLGEYYVDHDEDSGLYCVFHTDKGNGHAYASYTTEQEALEACRQMNRVDEHTDKGRRVSANEDHHSMAPHTEDSGRFVTKRVVGHEDREARMMQRELLKIADYAQELCDMLEHLQDADFPHWWQSKLVKAGDYMSTIKHFLDGEQRLGAREPLDHEISVMPIADDMLALGEDQDSDEDHAEMGPDGKPFDPTRLYRWGKKFWQDQQNQVYDRLVDLYGQDRVRKITHPVSGGKQIDLLTNHYDDDFIADLHRDRLDYTIPRSAEKAKIRGFDAYLGADGKFYSLEGQGIPYEMPKDEW